MTDNTENLVLEHLRATRANIAYINDNLLTNRRTFIECRNVRQR